MDENVKAYHEPMMTQLDILRQAERRLSANIEELLAKHAAIKALMQGLQANPDLLKKFEDAALLQHK